MKNVITSAFLVILSASALLADEQDYQEPEPYWAEAARREARGEYEGKDYSACLTHDCLFDFLIIAAPIAVSIANAPVAVAAAAAVP